MRRRPAFLFAGAVLLILLVATTVTLRVRQRSKLPPANNAFVGWTKQQILDRLGEPDGKFDGHYGLAPEPWASEHPHCQTFTYNRWGGTLYLTVETQDGTQVGLCSTWLPQGAAF